MLYDALEVARYIISKCSYFGKPVSNLKLQEMIYFVLVDFYKKEKRKLFIDDICAWKLGPIVPGVYYEYCAYAGQPIYEMYDTEIENSDKEILDSIIEKYVDVSVAKLVYKTHRKGTAWDCIYRNGMGNRKAIPFSLIVEKDVLIT